MNTNLKIVVGLCALVLVLLGAKVVLSQPPDQQQISQALDEALKAGREGRPGVVLDFLSRSVKLNESPVANRQEIGKFIQQYKPDISVMKIEPRIQGDRAVLETPVQVRLSLPGSPLAAEIPQVTIHLQKEFARKWLIVPTSKWRIVSIDAPEQSVAPFMLN